MKIVLAGGSGQVGQILKKAFEKKGDEVILLSRSQKTQPSTVYWDGKMKGDWFSVIDGADVVINLAGRTVNCRYTEKNMNEMMSSRVDSTKIIGQAISEAVAPPKLWLQASTATIYAHTFGEANGESRGVIGGKEPDVPAYWEFSVDIGKNWEKALAEAQTPQTRKVAMRTSLVMSPDEGGVFRILSNLTRAGLGGAIAGGKMFMSWIHEKDFVRAIQFIIDDESIEGAVNLTAPTPLLQKDFMRFMRKAWGMPIGLPATQWMIEIGAFFLRTDTELLLKSRKVVPETLLNKGFQFEFPEWEGAAKELVSRC